MVPVVFESFILLVFASQVECFALKPPEPILLTEPAGSIYFNSSYLGGLMAKHTEWIIAPKGLLPFKREPPLFRIFVEEIQLQIDGKECPADRRVTIGNANKPSSITAVAYCGYVQKFEIVLLAERVRISLEATCLTDKEENIVIRLHYGVVVPDVNGSELQRPGREACLDPLHENVTDSLHEHMWACRPVFYGYLKEIQCLETAQICNGIVDCPSGEDESTQTCKRETQTVIQTINEWQHWFNSSNKIDVQLTEQNSESVVKMHVCAPNEVVCARHANENAEHCISSAWVCDGFVDCPLGDDEDEHVCENKNATAKKIQGCSEGTFACPNDAKCLEWNFVCDGRRDCFDAFDESQKACNWRHAFNTSIVSQTSGFENDSNNTTPLKFVEWGLTNRLCAAERPYYCRWKQNCLPIPSLCNGVVECPDGLDESPMACGILRFIQPQISTQNKNTSVSIPTYPHNYCHGDGMRHQWVARVYSNHCFLCHGIIVNGGNNTRWILMPRNCGSFLPRNKLHFLPGNSTNTLVSISRLEENDGEMTSQKSLKDFILLQLNLSSTVPSAISTSIEGITLKSLPNSTLQKNSCKLITPVTCQPPNQGRTITTQVVNITDFEVCRKAYPEYEPVDNGVCVIQHLCIQVQLGATLICKENGDNTAISRLGFFLHGASCQLGQLGWPVVVQLLTQEQQQWVNAYTNLSKPAATPKPVGHIVCGRAPDGSFPWFVYFNISSLRSVCLGIYVENDTFPLITSERCLKKCLKANRLIDACTLQKAKLPAIEWLADPKPLLRWTRGVPDLPANLDKNICPAPGALARLENETSSNPVWRICVVAHLENITSNAIVFEAIRVRPFSECKGEIFYIPHKGNILMCVEATDNAKRLNCEGWTDSGLVQCRRTNSNQWETVGLAPPCRSTNRRKWFLRMFDWK